MMNTTTAAAMKVLTANMKNGKMTREAADNVLRANHCTTVRTLARVGAVCLSGDYVLTPDAMAAEDAKREKAAKMKALKAEMKRMAAELAAMKG